LCETVSPLRRTVSSLGTDLESEAYGLIVLINRMNRIPLMKNAAYWRMFLIQFWR